MKKLLIVLVLLIAKSAYAEPRIEGTISELREYFLSENVNTVVLEATASNKVSYNKAVIKLLIKTENKNLATALEVNSKIRAKIKKMLVSSGIDKKNIKESKFSSTPEYGIFGDEPDSYKVENVLSIVVNTEQQMIKVASISDKEKGVRYVSSKPEIGDRSQIRSELIKGALAKINDKAVIYQNNLKIKLIPESFEDVSFNFIEQEPTPRLKKSKYSSYSSDQVGISSFGETKFSITLRVKFRVSRK